MTWTYDVAQLSTSQLMQVRRLIGDVKTNDQLLQDEEINFALSRYAVIELAAAECCRDLATQFAREVDLVQGELKTNYSNKARAFNSLAMQLENRGMARGGAIPYAGGISQSDKDTQVQDTDRVPPNFNRGEFDNLLPVSPQGQQTPAARPPDASDGGI